MFQYNIPLKKYNTFKVGGPADYFCEVKEKQELKRAIDFSNSKQLPCFILGGGSNLLINDNGFKGLVIKLNNSDCKVKDDRIFAQAGVSLTELVELSAVKGLSGLEWAAGIPGTLGGAIRGNAGAFGSCMSDFLEIVEVADENFSFHSLHKKDCRFSYRDSLFKHNSQIIFSAILNLKKSDEDLIRQKIEQNLNHRKERQPLNYPSAGSFFKNFPEKPAGQIIEEAGLKGKQIGGAMVSEKHGNFIINFNGATASNIKELAELIKSEVKEKTGYQLEEEIRYLGFD